MSENSENSKAETELVRPIESESALLKSVRVTINLITNILMTITVLMCVLFACSSTSITNYHLHIILCVLGYQFFMCQGILVVSKYNSWSMFMKRVHRRHIHWILQMVALALVIAGSCLIMKGRSKHFTMTHGTLGISALILSLVSYLTGLLAVYTCKCCSFISLSWLKYIHFLTGIAALMVSTASLTMAFEIYSFRLWLNHDALVPTLMAITWLYTIFVTIDFFIITKNRICCRP